MKGTAETRSGPDPLSSQCHFMLDPAGSAKSKKKVAFLRFRFHNTGKKVSTYLKCLCLVGELSGREGVEQSKRDAG